MQSERELHADAEVVANGYIQDAGKPSSPTLRLPASPIMFDGTPVACSCSRAGGRHRSHLAGTGPKLEGDQPAQGFGSGDVSLTEQDLCTRIEPLRRLVNPDGADIAGVRYDGSEGRLWLRLDLASAGCRIV